jgi:hypothetical protein
MFLMKDSCLDMYTLNPPIEPETFTNIACYNPKEDSLKYYQASELQTRINIIATSEYQSRLGLVFTDQTLPEPDTNGKSVSNFLTKKRTGEFYELFGRKIHREIERFQDNCTDKETSLVDTTELLEFKKKQDQEFAQSYPELHAENIYNIKEIYVTEEHLLSYDWEVHNGSGQETKPTSLFDFDNEADGEIIINFNEVKND